MPHKCTDPQTQTWSSKSVEELASEWYRQQETYVEATVIDTGGSTPRLRGARLVTNGAYFGGTVGGGAVEKLVLDKSAELLHANSTHATISVHLVRDLAMCCGGKMSVFLNKVEAKPSLIIFGAGHIGRALAIMAVEADFSVSVVDDRPHWIDEERFSGDIQKIDNDPVWLAKQPIDGAPRYYLIVTHSHELDQKLVEALLKSAVNPAFVGLIGSRGKWARFRERLLAKGFTTPELDRVHCPCGLDIGSETPGEIAVSVLAQLVQEHRSQRGD